MAGLHIEYVYFLKGKEEPVASEYLELGQIVVPIPSVLEMPIAMPEDDDFREMRRELAGKMGPKEN